MNKAKKKALEWIVAGTGILSAIFMFESGMKKLDAEILSSRKQQVIREAVLGDVWNIASFPHLCPSEEAEMIVLSKEGSFDKYDSFYLGDVYRRAKDFLEVMEDYAPYVEETMERERESAEIRDYIMDNVENFDRKYEMIPDTMFRDRG